MTNQSTAVRPTVINIHGDPATLQYDGEYLTIGFPSYVKWMPKTRWERYELPETTPTVMKLDRENAERLYNTILRFPGSVWHSGKYQLNHGEGTFGPGVDTEKNHTVKFQDANGNAFQLMHQFALNQEELQIGPVVTVPEGHQLINASYTLENVNELIYFIEAALEM